MEVMEDGNLMDKVNILIQRDMEYYKAHQTILQETMCPGIIGGRLDFPRSASFAAVKLVVWWEDEYVAAYRKPSGFFQKNIESTRDSIEASGGCGGIIRSSDPTKFISALSKSADQLLEHLHILTQEALDHADLTVLTGTIGAAALLKNCLWFYIQILSNVKSPSIGPIQNGYKKYHEMCEALAERLLDLHCRLLSLYILQDADCLDWENIKPFFESERGSYIIQMWWLYMQGTREDLWNTVPPKMAQRVFSGMLNESLTILTVRYTQSLPSEARSDLLIVDISNLLLCVAQLLPFICDTAGEFINLPHKNSSKILRDIHVKCQELYVCLLLRGSSLDTLYKVFNKGIENVNLFKPKLVGPASWLVFSLPNIYKNHDIATNKINEVDERSFLALELMVLLAQPQPNWALLLKVLCSKNFKILHIILTEFIEKSCAELKRTVPKSIDCGMLLCAADGSCKNVDTTSSTLSAIHYYDLIMSTTEVLLSIGNDEELKQFLVQVVMRHPNWSKCFERRHVWNQIRFPWYEAILNTVSPILSLVVEVVINALQTGATMYQAMSLIVACFSQYWDIIDPSLPRIAHLFQDVIPSNVTPISKSVLMQILVCALYTSITVFSENLSVKKEVTFENPTEEECSKLEDTPTGKMKGNIISTSSAGLAAAESLCSIDEDNKHTDQIEEFLNQANTSKDDISFFTNSGSERVEQNQQILEILASDLLINTQGKKSLKTLFHFIKNNSEWLYWKLRVSEKEEQGVPNKVVCPPEPLLHKMFHIGYRPFDQLLTKLVKPNWQNLLQAPMGLTLEKVWMQISCRWEFRTPTSTRLSMHEMDIVDNLCLVLKQ